jgi:hypothetical protein
MNSDGNHTDSHRVCGGSDVACTGGRPTPVCRKGEKCEQFGCWHQHPSRRKPDCRFGQDCWNNDCEGNHPLTNSVHHPAGTPEPHDPEMYDYDPYTEWMNELHDQMQAQEDEDKRRAEPEELAEDELFRDPNLLCEVEDKVLHNLHRLWWLWKRIGRRRP